MTSLFSKKSMKLSAITVELHTVVTDEDSDDSTIETTLEDDGVEEIIIYLNDMTYEIHAIGSTPEIYILNIEDCRKVQMTPIKE